MNLFALSDLHLSLGSNKPMDVFDDRWKDHHLTIMENWNNIIRTNDVVMIPGDISWALKLTDALPDLDFINKLNGRKVLLRGNHDYWWNSVSKLNKLHEGMFFLQNTHYEYGDIAICGTRGWVNLNDREEEDEKIYKREILRLQMSLESGKKAGFQEFIVMMHYPPVTRISKSKEFLDVLREYNVKRVVYGHVHNDAKEICINGDYQGMEMVCTSCDIINFTPVKIL